MLNITPPKAPIQVFDSSLNFLGEVDTYESLDHMRGWNKPGPWSCAINWNIFDDSGKLRYASLFEIGGFITIGNDGYKCGIISSIDKPLDQDGKQSQMVTISGSEPTSIFNRRMLDVPPGLDVYSLNAPAETIIKTVVSDQCGPTSTNVNRQFPLLSINPDLGRGQSYLISNAYTNVLDELSNCSIATLLGFYIYLDRANKQLVLDCSLGNNLVAGQPGNVIFSTNYDTLMSADLKVTNEQYKNLATVTGKGQGASRTVLDVFNGTEPLGMDRFETYVNANDKTSTPDLTLKGQAQLGTYQYTSTLEGMCLAKSPLTYQQDYNLGDYVTIQAYDYSLNKQITSVQESWGHLSYELTPTFDKAPATLTSQMVNVAANLGAQVSKLGVVATAVTPTWLPYPAGAYTFPSGVQTVAAGFMPVGATVTAPTFGAGTTQRGFYMDNGNKTINMRCDIHQTSLTGAVAGSVTYLLAPPAGYQFDSSKIEFATNDFNGGELGYFTITGNYGGAPLIMQGKGTPISATTFRLGMALYSASNAGNWNTTYFPPTLSSEIMISFIFTNIPIL